MLYLKANPHSQVQWQVAQANTKAKTCHRACLFSNADLADTKKTKSFKNKGSTVILVDSKIIFL